MRYRSQQTQRGYVLFIGLFVELLCVIYVLFVLFVMVVSLSELSQFAPPPRLEESVLKLIIHYTHTTGPHFTVLWSVRVSVEGGEPL